MTTPGCTLGTLNVATAALMVALSIPLVLRKVPMNRFYGVRIPKSFSSESNWYAINAYGVRQLILWSMLPLVAGIVCFFIRIDDQSEGLGVILGTLPVMLTCLVTLILTVRFSKTL